MELSLSRYGQRDERWALRPPLDGDFAAVSEISDDELEALALAGDPDQPLDPTAEPLMWATRHTTSLLPGWYMPPALARIRGGWRARVIVGLVLSFVFIELAGLCFTYGPVRP